jgi:hypothetical protein
VYRGTQASSGGGGSLPNRVEVWDTTTSPATRLYGIDQTRIPIAALVVPPVAATSTPKSVFFLFYTITSGATGPTLIRYDAATMSVLNTYTPAITIDDNNANLYYDEISDPPPPPPTPPPPPIPYLFVQGPYAVLKINLNTNTVVQTYVSPRGATINGSAYYNQTIWLTTAGATVRRVNADTMTEVASVSTSGTFQANSICAGPNGVNFCIQNNGFHARHINPATNTITASTPVDNFTRFAVDGDTQFFVMNQDDRLWRMDATTTARTDPSLFTTVFNVVTPFSVIDAQTSSTVGYAPRWSKPVYGPYGAARFVSLNGLEICEDEGWHLGIMGI